MLIYNNRPKMKLPNTFFENTLQLISILGIAATYAILLMNWGDLPEKVPTHFGVSGAADAWGVKGNLLILPLLVTAVYSILSQLEKFPHSFNYICEITEQNAEYQYRNARMLVRCLKMELIYLFGYVEWMAIQGAIGKAEGLGIMFLPVFIITLLGTMGIFIFRMVK